LILQSFLLSLQKNVTLIVFHTDVLRYCRSREAGAVSFLYLSQQYKKRWVILLASCLRELAKRAD